MRFTGSRITRLVTISPLCYGANFIKDKIKSAPLKMTSELYSLQLVCILIEIPQVKF